MKNHKIQKLILIIRLILFVFFGFLSINNAKAESCLGGTTSLNTEDNSAFIFSANNTCINVTSTGSKTTSGVQAIYNPSFSGIEIQNAGTLRSNITSYGIQNNGAINLINNSGYIEGRSGLINWGSITTVFNSGTIYGLDATWGAWGGINMNGGTITTLTNTGSISAANGFGILINTTITTLNNAQGGNGENASTTALRAYFGGLLPTNYNIIINNANHYGQLVSLNGSGSTVFGIYEGSLITSRLYTGVLQDFGTGNVGVTRTGTYDNMNWTLALQSGSSTTWDLSFTGTSLAQTQSSLASHARKLSGTLNIASLISNFSNSNTYDCNLFDVKGMCISAGGRVTTIDNLTSNHSAAVVVLGYKVNSNIRIGGFLDQSVNNNMPSGVDMSNKNPMMGAFAVWNHQADGLGYQVKIANAYQDKDVTTTRDVIGSSEAGTGKTNLNTQSYVGELSYAFNYQDSTIVRPYFAVRYTNIKQDAYIENLTVSNPLSYAKLGDRSTTALMGVKLNHALTPKTNLTASLGIEQDINHKTDQLTASGVADLTSENFNNNIKRTRPVASAGAYYAVAKNQRLSGEVYYQQLPFQSTGSATAYVNYMIGF